MIELDNIKHIFLYPGTTDFRNGIYGLRRIIGEVENHSLYVFANKTFTQLKLIEIDDNAVWLYQKKLNRGKFIYPKIGDKTLLNKDDIRLIIQGISLINKIETNGKVEKTFIY